MPLPPQTTALESRSLENAHPVAVMMGSASNPVVYMPSNVSNFLSDSESDPNASINSVVSDTHTVLLISPSPPVHRPSLTVVVLNTVSDSSSSALPGGGIAPLKVPHLYWCCSILGPSTDFPFTIEALIDNGLHAVLI